jgi:hypothetical protein
MSEGELWTLTFRVIPGPTPARSRINRLLKIAKGYGLVCVRLGGASSESRPAPDDGKGEIEDASGPGPDSLH